mmetsp:Transcript_60466/g.129699  ORF Transcript_60466/g.129699 Transcript_60466/m.129699 type:complete len:233 (-) Transcript_60466:26-724(-)
MRLGTASSSMLVRADTCSLGSKAGAFAESRPLASLAAGAGDERSRTLTVAPAGSHWQPWKCRTHCSAARVLQRLTVASPQGLPGHVVTSNTASSRPACSSTTSIIGKILLGRPLMSTRAAQVGAGSAATLLAPVGAPTYMGSASNAALALEAAPARAAALRPEGAAAIGRPGGDLITLLWDFFFGATGASSPGGRGRPGGGSRPGGSIFMLWAVSPDMAGEQYNRRPLERIA